MATYSVAASEVGVYEKTLVASTVDTVTFAGDLSRVEVVSDGAAALYFTVDGSTPTVAGQGTWNIPAAAARRSVDSPEGGGTVVKLISAGAPTYSVLKA